MATLYDAYNRPIQMSQLRRELAAPTTMGVRNAAHFPMMSVALTPEKLASILRSVDAGNADPYLTLAEEMEEKELHYASVLSTRKDAIASLQVVVESFSDDARDIEQADAVRNLLTGDSTADLVSDLADALGKSYSVCETMWEMSEKQWWPAAFKWRDPRFFRFDLLTRTELRLLDQAGTDLPLAPGKFVVHYPKLKTGLPIRGGLARLASLAYMMKGYTLKDWLAFAEVFGMPLRLGKYSPGTSAEDQAALLRAVAQIGADAAGIISTSTEIEFVQPGNQTAGSVLFEKMADWIDSQVSKGVIGQTMTSDQGSSRSQAEVHDKVRGDIRDKDAKQMAGTIKRDIVRPFIDLNFGVPKVRGGYPKLRLQVEEPEDLKLLSESLPPFINLGLRVSESEIRDKFGLSEPDDDDVVLAPAAKPSATADGAPDPEADPSRGKAPKQQKRSSTIEADDVREETAAEKARKQLIERCYARVLAGHPLTDDERALMVAAESRPLDTVDEQTQDVLRNWQAMMGPITSPIEELAATADSAEDFIDGLHGLVGRLGISELTAQLAQWGFIARGTGNATDEP